MADIPSLNQQNMVKVIVSEGAGEIVLKKSRFIATVKKVESETEANAFIESTRKKYWDASHNCSAMIIKQENSCLTRCSDDGEPAGTAGRPILEVLSGENLYNVCVVVTRYFGGTLLGTGGLIRAYTQATKEGISNCQIGVMRKGINLNLITDYNHIGKILFLLGEKGITPLNSEYTDKITLTLLFPLEWKESMIKDFTEACAGRVHITILNECYYIDKA